MIARYIQAVFTQRMVFVPVLLLLVLGLFFREIMAAGFFALVLMAGWYHYRTEFALLALLAVFFLADNQLSTFGFAQNLRFLVLFLGLLYLFPKHLFARNPANYILPFALYLVVISLLFSPLGTLSILRAIGFYLIPLFIFKATEQLYRINKKANLLVFLFLSACLSVHILVLPIESAFLVGRFRGLMGNPNGLAMWVVFAYGLAHLVRRKAPQQIGKRYLQAFKLIGLALVLLTGSRTALIALVVYEYLYLFFKYPRFRLLLTLFSAGIVLLLWNTDLRSLLVELGLAERLRVDTLDSASGRLEVWAVAWDAILSNPWLGRGPGYDIYYIDGVADTLFGENRPRQWYGVWSSYLSLLLNAGVIGLLIYAWGLRRMIRKMHLKQLGYCFLAMVLTLGVTESWMAASMNAFTPMFFLYLAIQHQPQNNDR